MATKTILLTSGTTWTVPADLDTSVNIDVTAIGGGGGGRRPANGTNIGATGGGGGALSKVSLSLSGLTPGTSTVFINIGSGGSGATTAGTNGGTGGDTWLNKTTNAAPSSTANGLLAKGGGGGTASAATSGGAAASGVGDTRYSGGGSNYTGTAGGGSGGGSAADPTGGGWTGGSHAAGYYGGGGGGGTGGAGGTAQSPLGIAQGANGGLTASGAAGGAGSTAPGVAGSAGTNGGGGGGGSSGQFGVAASAGGAGGAGAEFSLTAGGTIGCGGGGGGGGTAISAGVNGGAGGGGGGRGGGGGGGGGSSVNTGNGGNGGQGAIIITYTVLALATAYWVGGTGTWDATSATNWASTSGGAGGAGYAGANTNVIFDANSGTGTITINGGICNDLTIAAGASAVALAPTTNGLTIYGNLSISSTTPTISGAAAITFAATTAKTITTSGETIDCPVIFNGVGGTWALQDNMTVGATRTTTLTNGTLDINGKTLSTGIFSSSNSNTRALTSSTAATLSLTGTGSVTLFEVSTVTNLTGSNNITVQLNGTDSATKTINIGALSDANSFNFLLTSTQDISLVPTNFLFSSTAVVKNLTLTDTNHQFKTAPAGTGIVIYGNLNIQGTTPSLAISGTLFFQGTSGTKTIATSGKLIPGNITFNGAGSTWQLVDNLTINSSTLTTTLTAGTLDLNGKTLTTGLFNSSNSNTRSLISATAATVNITNSGDGTMVWDTGTSANLTGSNNITVNITDSSSVTKQIRTGTPSETNAFNFTFGGGIRASSILYVNNLTITNTSYTIDLAGSLLYGNLNIQGTNPTFTGLQPFTFASTSGTKTITTSGKTLDFPLIFDGIGGTWQLADNLTLSTIRSVTVTAGTLDLNGRILSTGTFNGAGSSVRGLISATTTTIYITGAGGGTVWNTSGTNLTGSNNITVLITGNDAVTKTISTGTLNEANAFNFTVGGNGTTITFTASNTVKNLTITNTTCTISNVSITIYGNLVVQGTNPTMVFDAISTWTFASTSGTRTITTNGEPIAPLLTFNGVGGTWQLVDNLTVTSSGRITLTNGTLDLNGKVLNAGASFITATGTKNLTFNGGELICLGTSTTAFNNAAPTNFTTTAGTGTGKISMTGATAKTFVGGGSTYNCTLDNAGAGALTITGNNTFTTISSSVQPTTFTFTAGSTQTVTNFNVSGTAGNLVTIDSTSAGTRATLSDLSGLISVSYCSIKDSNATGGAIWKALTTNGNVDAGNNLGWIFSSPTQGQMMILF